MTLTISFYFLTILVIILGFIIGKKLSKYLEKKLLSKNMDNLIGRLKLLEKKNNSKILFIVDNYIRYSNYKLEKYFFDLNIDSIDYFIDWISNNNKKFSTLQIIIHTNGGYLDVSDLIFVILLNYKGQINIYIPYYAFSAGTFIALCGDKIFMNYYSVMGPVDPQIGFDKKINHNYPANTLINLYKLKKKSNKLTNENIINILEGKKLYFDNINNLKRLFESKKFSKKQISKIIRELSSGKNPHCKPFTSNMLMDLGIKIYQMPDEINELFDLFKKIRNKIDNKFIILFYKIMNSNINGEHL